MFLLFFTSTLDYTLLFKEQKIIKNFTILKRIFLNVLLLKIIKGIQTINTAQQECVVVNRVYA